MANGKVFINPKTGYLSNREKDLPPPPSRGPALTVRNPTHGFNSGSSSTPSPTLDKGKGKVVAHSISASSSRSNYSHLSYLTVGSVSSSKAKAKPFAAAASSSKAGVGGPSSAGPSMSKAPVRAALPSKPGASATFPSYDAGKIKASNPSPCYLTGIGRPKELRTLPGPARVGPASGADFRTPAGAPQIGLTWMLTNKGSPTANRRPLPLIPPRRVPIARAQRSFPATTPSSDRSSRACNRTPDPAKSSISSFWLSGSSPSASTASVGRTSSFFSTPTITVEEDLGTVDDDNEMLEYGRYLYEQGLEEDDGERTLTVRNYNEGDLRARHWRTSTFASIRLTTCSPTDTTHSGHSTSSTASSRPSSLRVRAMRARTLDKLEGRAPGAPIPNPSPVAGPIFMPASTPTPTPSPPPGPSKFKQFLDRQKVNLRTAKNKVKWKLQGRTVVRPVARDGPSNFDID